MLHVKLVEAKWRMHSPENYAIIGSDDGLLDAKPLTRPLLA